MTTPADLVVEGFPEVGVAALAALLAPIGRAFTIAPLTSMALFVLLLVERMQEGADGYDPVALVAFGFFVGLGVGLFLDHGGPFGFVIEAHRLSLKSRVVATLSDRKSTRLNSSH